MTLNWWAVPTWHGDLRLVTTPGTDGLQTTLTIIRPTPAELAALVVIEERFKEEGWIEEAFPKIGDKRRKYTVQINATVGEIGPVVAKALRPGDGVLTALRLEDARIVAVSGDEKEIAETVKEMTKRAKKDKTPAPEKAVTVKRPTPSCPNCIAGSVAPARDVLLSFLTPAQHETWARERFIVVEGHLSGNRYRLAHRDTPLAQAQTRICYDLDDRMTVHFHDRSVPPEEEVLAAKICLEQREHWLRNEATLVVPSFFGGYAKRSDVLCFKNPFGTIQDGVLDANLTASIGSMAVGALIGKSINRLLNLS